MCTWAIECRLKVRHYFQTTFDFDVPKCLFMSFFFFIPHSPSTLKPMHIWKCSAKVGPVNFYRNGSNGPNNNRNDVNLIDYTTNETHQSKIESPLPTSPSSTIIPRNKNPFLIGEMKHSDDCTQSPMKICLVVSPPTSKLLQVMQEHKSYVNTHNNKKKAHKMMHAK